MLEKSIKGTPTPTEVVGAVFARLPGSHDVQMEDSYEYMGVKSCMECIVSVGILCVNICVK